MEPVVVATIVVVAALIALAAVAARFRRKFVVYESERGLHFVEGRLTEVLDPGPHVFWGSKHEVKRVDVRPKTEIVASQEILTSDGVPIRLSAAVLYRIADAASHYRAAATAEHAAYVAVQLAMRDGVANQTAENLLGTRNALGEEMTARAKGEFERIGMELERISIRDLTLPPEMRRVFTQVLVAQKEGLAALERARGESAALRSLANASRLLADNPGLLHLRLIQAVETGKATVVLDGSGKIIPTPTNP